MGSLPNHTGLELMNVKVLRKDLKKKLRKKDGRYDGRRKREKCVSKFKPRPMQFISNTKTSSASHSGSSNGSMFFLQGVAKEYLKVNTSKAIIVLQKFAKKYDGYKSFTEGASTLKAELDRTGQNTQVTATKYQATNPQASQINATMKVILLQTFCKFFLRSRWLESANVKHEKRNPSDKSMGT